ncbi:MAG: phosphatidylglycerol lysyltransferase domain-containing protein, partial [Clostridiales Family XIII bacterium]|nr:phosphatidylglycerol lysyltransferase domain-containing protein [Clostridiales Family XIII bacterium]
KLRIEADRANFDYVYNTQDLIELKGRDYHAKKNHLNYFLNNYEYEYVSLHSAMADEAMDFIRRFNERKNLADTHEKELLLMEERAMHDVFHNLEAIGYLTGAIRINGSIEALSIGGRLGKKTVTVHVEKANTEFRGLYQAINNEFCKHVAKDVKRINREEDMGIPGLRKAKLSYKPVMLVEKYTVSFVDPQSCRRFR